MGRTALLEDAAWQVTRSPIRKRGHAVRHQTRYAICRSVCIAYSASLVPSATSSAKHVAEELKVVQRQSLLPH